MVVWALYTVFDRRLDRCYRVLCVCVCVCMFVCLAVSAALSGVISSRLCVCLCACGCERDREGFIRFGEREDFSRCHISSIAKLFNHTKMIPWKGIYDCAVQMSVYIRQVWKCKCACEAQTVINSSCLAQASDSQPVVQIPQGLLLLLPAANSKDCEVVLVDQIENQAWKKSTDLLQI